MGGSRTNNTAHQTTVITSAHAHACFAPRCTDVYNFYRKFHLMFFSGRLNVGLLQQVLYMHADYILPSHVIGLPLSRRTQVARLLLLSVNFRLIKIYCNQTKEDKIGIACGTHG